MKAMDPFCAALLVAAQAAERPPAGSAKAMPHPDYDPMGYQKDKEHPKRMEWGPFEGRRPLDADEKPATTTDG